MTQSNTSYVRSSRDLSQPAQAEAALRESDQRYQAILENVPVGIGIADIEGNLLFYNDAIVKTGGYTREEVAAIGNVAKLYYDPSEREEVLALAREQGFVSQHEVRFKRKDGTPYHTLLSLTPNPPKDVLGDSP